MKDKKKKKTFLHVPYFAYLNSFKTFIITEQGDMQIGTAIII